MRKFTESLSSNDIFGDVENIKLLLVDFSDYNLSYTISYHLQKYRTFEDTTGQLNAVRTSDISFDDLYEDLVGLRSEDFADPESIKLNKNYYKSYIIRFRETYDILTSDQQINGRAFGIPTSKTYNFMEAALDVQHKVEQLGHTFALAMRDGKFDIMILQGKHK